MVHGDEFEVETLAESFFAATGSRLWKEAILQTSRGLNLNSRCVVSDDCPLYESAP